MKLQKGIKLRIYPNKEQKILLTKTFGCCRFLYNEMLEEQITVDAHLKDDKDELAKHKYNTEKEYEQEYPLLKEVDAKALQTSKQAGKSSFQDSNPKSAIYRPTLPTTLTTAYG